MYRIGEVAKASGYSYAGLQFGGQCWAGNTLGYTQVADSSCNMACTANTYESCGGSYLNSIYSTSGMPASVAIGGVQGFDNLATSSNTSTLRGYGQVTLYLHGLTMQIMRDAGQDSTLSSIQSVFSGTGGGVAEHSIFDVLNYPSTSSIHSISGTWNLSSLISSWVTNNYTYRYLTPGFKPDEGLYDADTLDASTYPTDYLTAWEAITDSPNITYMRTMAPVFTPNGLTDAQIGSFTDSTWNFLRTAALYSGEIAIDSPPDYYLAQSPTYQNFIADEIKWAHDHGVKSNVIISPNKTGSSFLSNTQSFVSTLLGKGATPSMWSVVTYDVYSPGPQVEPIYSGYQNYVGPESTPNTVTAVALWVEQNAARAFPVIPTGSGSSRSRIHLRDNNGKFLTVGASGCSTSQTTFGPTTVGACETFKFFDLTHVDLTDGDQMYLESPLHQNGSSVTAPLFYYLSSICGGGTGTQNGQSCGYVWADRTTPSTWETFILVKDSSSPSSGPTVYVGDKVRLISSGGYYCESVSSYFVCDATSTATNSLYTISW